MVLGIMSMSIGGGVETFPASRPTPGGKRACVADGPSPFESAAEQDMARQLYALVQQLEEGAREAVHLHYYQGLTLQETAEVLNIATSTLKYRLREALNLLRAQTAATQ